MSVGSVAPDVILALLCMGSLVLLPRIWRGWYAETISTRRGSRTRGEVALMWWPFGDASRRGAIRGLVPLRSWD